MPVRSLNSSVLKWPDAKSVENAVREWAARVTHGQRRVCRVGYFGSYARGDWGVGSDLDLLIVVDESEEPFEKRASEWDTTELPVPVDLLVYTRKEWESLDRRQRFYQTLMREAVWVYGDDGCQDRRIKGN